ncbi:hypothetical protein AWZ03_014650 [Drosophila navojoa]|uniref:Uncharacterized protein n=1 Tax=Drosophila navojoa TaxID=7232 RepID=A0A484AQR6_DRONA|nr:hypothetical protein AWZ03_014650 [Drosophila navojoa]
MNKRVARAGQQELELEQELGVLRLLLLLPLAAALSGSSISRKQIDKLDLSFGIVALKRKCNICCQRDANRFLNAYHNALPSAGKWAY